MRNNLVAFRKKLGFTQEEMSALFGKKPKYWCFLELGQRKGDPELWVGLQIKFNLTAEETKKLMEVDE